MYKGGSPHQFDPPFFMENERRAQARVPTNLAAHWHGVSGSHEGRIEDVSVAGCFVNTRESVDVGEIINLVIQLPGGRWLPVTGKVAFYQQLIGFGVSFIIICFTLFYVPRWHCAETCI